MRLALGDRLLFHLLVLVVRLQLLVALLDDLVRHAVQVARRKLVSAEPLEEVGVRHVTFALLVVPE